MTLVKFAAKLIGNLYAQGFGLNNPPRPAKPVQQLSDAGRPDAEANLGWPSRQHERADPYLRGPQPVGPYGWIPQAGDKDLLARIIFAEGEGTPQDHAAIGWATVNRVNDRRYRPTLLGVLNQPKQFEIVEAGGGPAGGSKQWRQSARPEQLTGSSAEAWKRASTIAARILDGSIRDPTGGANHFFAGDRYVRGRPETAKGWFGRGMTDKKIVDAPYQSGAVGSRKNHFFVEVN